jgi:hypothetical protein
MPALQSYQHFQSAPSALWSINHNLGVFPVTDVMVDYNGVLTKIIPMGINVIDLNNVEIHFSTPYTGQARMV